MRKRKFWMLPALLLLVGWFAWRGATQRQPFPQFLEKFRAHTKLVGSFNYYDSLTEVHASSGEGIVYIVEAPPEQVVLALSKEFGDSYVGTTRGNAYLFSRGYGVTVRPFLRNAGQSKPNRFSEVFVDLHQVRFTWTQLSKGRWPVWDTNSPPNRTLPVYSRPKTWQASRLLTESL